MGKGGRGTGGGVEDRRSGNRTSSKPQRKGDIESWETRAKGRGERVRDRGGVGGGERERGWTERGETDIYQETSVDIPTGKSWYLTTFHKLLLHAERA